MRSKMMTDSGNYQMYL